MYHVGERTRPCPFPVTGNGHGRVTEPKGDQLCDMIPKIALTRSPIRREQQEHQLLFCFEQINF